LTGALFTKEYSIQAAALFNPSVVVHPDQSGLSNGRLRFLISLRATGEGHISSIIFQSGILDGDGNIILEKGSGYYTCLHKNENKRWEKKELRSRLSGLASFEIQSIDFLPEQFTERIAMDLLREKEKNDSSLTAAVSALTGFFDSNYDLTDSSDILLSEKVIFPSAKAESMGMEDLRLVQFNEEGGRCYYGTYTAYNGKEIRTQLIKTKDFNLFSISTMTGPAIQDKGMALFPEKINGKYAMISRQGGEKIHLMYSDNLYHWNDYQVLLEPEFTWEMVQMGNCGSPLKTNKGWLLLIHGVGTMRTYVISALLLDLKDPSKVLRRLKMPLLKADSSEREGYVPNVVYTCGLIQHEQKLFVPYAMSDAATGFFTVDLTDLLNEMK
ncbi:MAG TPA: glycoside hydrolase family 130 protein, partial [Puia sp.]